MSEYTVTVEEGDGCMEQVSGGCCLVLAAVIFFGFFVGTGAAGLGVSRITGRTKKRRK